MRIPTAISAWWNSRSCRWCSPTARRSNSAGDTRMDPKLRRTIALAVVCGCFALYGTAIGQQQQSQQPQQQQRDQQKKDRASGGTSAQQQGEQKKDGPVAGRIKLGATIIETEAIA